MSDTLYVLAASYDRIEDAEAEYQAIEAAHRHVGTSHSFDAAVVAKDETGKVDVVHRHEEQKRHGAAVGLNWGLAIGAVAALFPAIGLIGGMAAGGGAGALLGALSGHANGGMRKEDLTAIGEVLERGDAGLVVVYSADMADRVMTTVTGTHRVSATTTITAEQIAAEMSAHS